ncbi:MAG: 23S rRNA (guanosine(2251)-2'-O)-methyltransferase RlmB, partial [Chloroflexota bacterium]|nr:23S rRNA (guanosine(2251)-2'-O)-methyltransferase RlmB [Chloroflexota bacterium]
GRQSVIEALKSGRPINRILLAQNIGRHTTVGEILRLSQAEGIPVEYVAGHVIDKLATTAAHQGVLAYAAVKEYVALEDLLAISREREEPPLYCILDGIEDPQNLGAIIRTAEASGIHGVVIRSRRAVGLTAAVAKASAGAVEYVAVARVANISQAMLTLRKSDVWIVGLDPTGKIDYGRVDFRLPTAIVIGNEGKGLSDLVQKRCDSLVSIPMRGKTSSLNASVAAALVMYEAFRQRSSIHLNRTEPPAQDPPLH